MKQEVSNQMTPMPNNTPDENELSLINTYTRNPLSAEEIYCFSITLCDNEVDRDFERFSVKALEELSELFIGKTGISDHDMSSRNQTARIYKTWLEKDSTKKTSAGEDYVALKAKAYMLRNSDTESLVAQIEAGIKKEVSVGCSMKSMVCSICSKDMKAHECNHIKGKYYGKKLCYGILSQAGDAYEWSFVAVPAQKNAGVTKSFGKRSKTTVTASAEKACDEVVCSKEFIHNLEKQAEDGRLYKQYLCESIRKYALITMPRVDITAFISHCEEMSVTELKSLRDGLRAQAGEIIPVTLQLKALQDRKNETNNNVFKI
ncbi:MAG: hypothetical protein E7544_01425 [Ruminococcaceae bacterium]|nr:hypothetical protein [Oscillospiraceae bacterium]